MVIGIPILHRSAPVPPIEARVGDYTPSYETGHVAAGERAHRPGADAIADSGR
jgi:hypothetical protein